VADDAKTHFLDAMPSSPSDAETTVAELRRLVADFVAERDWSQFHSPKNVSMALAIEAAELMEHFQWLTTEASRRLADDPQKLAEVGEELADVVGYSFALANELGIDLSSAIRAKMVKNAQKYPADQYRGRYGPEDNG
jgi:NTP pyrophosphatase (non-canonical NTP hydrolase)